MKKLLYLVCLLIFTTMSIGVHASSEAEAQKAIAAAKAAQIKADALQGGWVTTDKLIKKAEKALTKGDSKKALMLARKAAREAEMARTQAAHEQKNWSLPPYARPK